MIFGDLAKAFINAGVESGSKENEGRGLDISIAKKKWAHPFSHSNPNLKTSMAVTKRVSALMRILRQMASAQVHHTALSDQYPTVKTSKF